MTDILMAVSLIGLVAAIVLAAVPSWGIKVYFWYQNFIENEKEFWRQRFNKKGGR